MAPGACMLIVDDEVEGVHAAQDALLAVEEFRPHAVIIDIVMPGKTGWELAGEIRSLTRASGCPILVALSGNYGRRENRRWFMPTLEPKRFGWTMH